MDDVAEDRLSALDDDPGSDVAPGRPGEADPLDPVDETVTAAELDRLEVELAKVEETLRLLDDPDVAPADVSGWLTGDRVGADAATSPGIVTEPRRDDAGGDVGLARDAG